MKKLIWKNNIFKNLFSNSVTSALTAGFQLISVPFFLNAWGLELYGEWIILNTLNSILQTTDLGLTTATSNILTIEFLKKNYSKCNSLITNNIFFLGIVFSLTIILIVVLNFLLPLSDILTLKVLNSQQIFFVVILIVIQIFFGMLTNSFSSIFIATNKYSRGVNIDNLIRFCEYIGIILSLFFEKGPISILIAIIFIKIIGLIIKVYRARSYFQFNIGISKIDFEILKPLILPSLNFVIFPIANSISQQGSIIIIGKYFNSSLVVLYNTTKTLVSLCRTLIDIISRSYWPQILHLYGVKNIRALQKTHSNMFKLTLGVMLISALFLIPFGENLYFIWLGNDIVFNNELFIWLFIWMIASGLQSTHGTILLATNNHQNYSLRTLTIYIFSVLANLIVISIIPKLIIIPMVLALSEFIILMYNFKDSILLTSDSYISFFNRLLK